MARETVALNEVGLVTDRELIARLRRLVRADQTLNARLLIHLGEVDARGLFREHACASMFTYCVEELRMSEAQAYLRIQAARLGRQFPRVLQLLAEGALHLTAIKLLGPHLTADNHVDVLERARCKGKREIELLVAELAPEPDIPNRVRKLPEPSTPQAQRTQAELVPTRVDTLPACSSPRTGIASRVQATLPPLEAAASSSLVDARSARITIPEACDGSRTPSMHSRAATASRAGSDAAFALVAPRHRNASTPLSPGRYKIEFTAGQALHDKLTQLRDLLRHQIPDGDLAVIVERAVDLLIDDTMKQRFAQTRVPKKPQATKRRQSVRANSRYIPRAVVRAVHQRDEGRCTFVSSDGKRCSARGFLEFHHHGQPYARGGKATLENLRLVCRAHNSLFAERDYGKAVMRSRRRQTGEPLDELGPEPRLAAPSASGPSTAGTALDPINSVRNLRDEFNVDPLST